MSVPFDDHYGDRKWYWSTASGTSTVSSASPFELSESRTVCAEAIRDYLALRDSADLDQTQTFLRGVQELPPGRTLRIGPQVPDGRLEAADWLEWPRSTEDDPVRAARFVNCAVKSAVAEALERPTVEEYHPTVTVSGGLDSSYVAAAVHSLGTATGSTVTLARGPDSFSSPTELRYIEILGDSLGSDVLHCPEAGELPRGDLAQRFIDANRGQPAPVGNLALAIYDAIAQMVKDSLGSAGILIFNGEGGDDLFEPGMQVVASSLPNSKRLSAILSSLNNQQGYRRTMRDAATAIAFSRNLRSLYRLRERARGQQSLDELAYGAEYASDIANSEGAWSLRRFDAAHSAGMSLAQYDAVAAATAAVRTVRGLNNYIRKQHPSTAICSPLVHSKVLKARLETADSLHLLGPLRMPVSKPLLRRAASLILPREIALAPKVNIPDTDLRTLGTDRDGVNDILATAAPCLRQLGIAETRLERDGALYSNFAVATRMIRLFHLSAWVVANAATC